MYQLKDSLSTPCIHYVKFLSRKYNIQIAAKSVPAFSFPEFSMLCVQFTIHQYSFLGISISCSSKSIPYTHILPLHHIEKSMPERRKVNAMQESNFMFKSSKNDYRLLECRVPLDCLVLRSELWLPVKLSVYVPLSNPSVSEWVTY